MDENGMEGKMNKDRGACPKEEKGNPGKQSATVGAEAMVWETATSIDKEAWNFPIKSWLQGSFLLLFCCDDF